MSTQATKIPLADFVSICLDLGAEDVAAIGAEMQRINADARMNANNWDAFIDRYLAIFQPEMRVGMERDHEETLYVALYENTPAGNKKADRLAAILNGLIANPAAVFGFLREEGDGVEWE